MADQLVIGIDASRAAKVQRTGVEQYAYHVIQELKRIVPPEFRVVLYSPEPLIGPLGELPPHWENRVLAWPPRRLWTQLRLSWEMLRRAPDLLFIPAHALPLILPRRAVTTMHDVAFMTHPYAYTPWGLCYLMVDAWLAVRRAAIVTVSEFSKSEISRYFGVDPAKITVTPLGYDAAHYRPVAPPVVQAVREKYDLGEKYFLYVGRVERKKNISGLLRAFALFKAARPPDDATRLVQVGKPGKGHAREVRAIAGSPAASAVRELGFTDEADIPALYTGATALMLTSWYEGFGLPVIEAYGCGTPAIVSNLTSLPEVAGDGALQVNPADPATIAAAMTRLADDAGLRARLAAAGAELIKKYSWQSCARGAWDAIERALH